MLCHHSATSDIELFLIRYCEGKASSCGCEHRSVFSSEGRKLTTLSLIEDKLEVFAEQFVVYVTY